MEIRLAAQTEVFLCAAIFGGCAGGLFDFFKALRLRARLGRWGTAVCDICFCLLTFVAFLLFLLAKGGGEIRGYILLGAALGAMLYFAALSELLLRLFGLLLGFLGTAARTAERLFEPPRGN